MYSLIKKFLFSLDPEVSHDFSLEMLGAAERLKLLSLVFKAVPEDPVNVMGLHFPNRVGLAAGLDKNGDYFNALGRMGFGCVEIGTVTPKPQLGNPLPRMFRLTEEQAIINRMGFNNKGVDYLVSNVSKRQFSGVLGINIGKNKVTPEDAALGDYERCMEAVYAYADYITINISSPNTPGLRRLQFGQVFDELLAGIKAKQKSLAEHHGKYVPVAVKIAPDMDEDDITQVAGKLLMYEIDAVIATNTTVDRSAIPHSPFKNELGGLSGLPLQETSTRVIYALSRFLNGAIPIIGVGGITDGKSARDKIDAGASLVQIYSGFIFQGPSLIGECVNAITSDH